MENDYWILENSQKILRGYMKNPDKYEIRTALKAFDELVELLVRAHENQDIFEKGMKPYLDFLFHSDVFPQEYKEELIQYMQAQCEQMAGWKEATKSVH